MYDKILKYLIHPLSALMGGITAILGLALIGAGGVGMATGSSGGDEILTAGALLLTAALLMGLLWHLTDTDQDRN